MSSSNPSPVDLANAMTADRREAQIRHAMSRQSQPQMVRQIDQPLSEQEIARQRNRRLQRHGASAADFREQLAAISREKDDTGFRLESCRRQATAALREGRMTDAKAFKGRVESAELELERMALLDTDAHAGLAAAEAREADDRRRLKAQIPASEKMVAEYQKALETEFPKLAARLKELVDLEAQSDAALRLLREAEAKLSEYRAPAAPSGPRLRGATIVPGFIERPRAPVNEGDLYAR